MLFRSIPAGVSGTDISLYVLMSSSKSLTAHFEASSEEQPVQPVAIVGEDAPELSGAVITAVENPYLSPTGDVYFTATVSGSDVTSGVNDKVLYHYALDGAKHMIARESVTTPSGQSNKLQTPFKVFGHYQGSGIIFQSRLSGSGQNGLWHYDGSTVRPLVYGGGTNVESFPVASVDQNELVVNAQGSLGTSVRLGNAHAYEDGALLAEIGRAHV